MTVSFITSRK